MINPVHLRTFVTLVDTQHFTKASDVLHMTQPGVSQHIKKLELQLSCPLINRFGKKFELTEAGEQLYRFAQQQFKEEAELLEGLSTDQAEKGEIKLACSGSMAMKLYPELLQLQKAYPATCVSMEAAPNHAIYQQIKSNRTDVGLVTQQSNDPELEQQLLGYDALCLVVPKGSDSRWDSLTALGFINHPDGHHYAIQVLEVNYPQQFRGINQIAQRGYINQLSQILLPVSEGMGFTVLPKSAISMFPDQEKIEVVPLKVAVKEPVYKVSKKYRPLPKRYELIESVLNKVVSS